MPQRHLQLLLHQAVVPLLLLLLLLQPLPEASPAAC
jgi:hypothetical protein